MSGSVVLRATGIHKRFGGVTALAGVDLVLRAGEVHGLIGQNGAGKSTLVKVIDGVHRPDAGTLELAGSPVVFDSPRDARAAGIAMVFQEFSLVPTLSVAHNVLLLREPRTRLGLTDEQATVARAAAILDDLGVAIDPRAETGSLPVGSQQLVEIAKATAGDPRILVLDEPTASLTSGEVATLFRVVRRLRDRGVAIVYISHHLAEVREICDTITVLRDGLVRLSGPAETLALDEILASMTGRSATETAMARPVRMRRSADPVLALDGWSLGSRIRDLSLVLRPGEIVGIAGLLGSGRTSLLRSIVGLEPGVRGTMRVGGQACRPTSPAAAGDLGIAYVPEDRRREGIIAGQSVQANHLAAIWGRLSRLGFVDEARAGRATRDAIATLGVKTSGARQPIEELSGGNQQKVVVGRALAREPSVLLLDDPTAGIDIASRRELLEHLRGFADAGGAVLLVSSELEELAAVADRVIVLDRGRIAASLDPADGSPLDEGSIIRAIQAGTTAPVMATVAIPTA